MTQQAGLNRRIVLASRPNGLPAQRDFRMSPEPIPSPREGEVLLRTKYLSLDPYMRNLMDEVGPGYAPPVALGATMVGGTVSQVVESRHPAFSPGQLVLANAGWQDYALSDGSDLMPLKDLDRPSLALGGLGMPGFTAHVGLMDIGRPRPGETVVVAAATGAVGAVVGQIARIHGARVIGIASGAGKCRQAVEELGFDACVDRAVDDFEARLAQACPQGIDVYFENVGGRVLQAVLPLLNLGARVPVCGFIAHYNDATPPQGPDRLPQLLRTVLAKRVHLQGFIILDHYGERFQAFQTQMKEWLAAGRIVLHEHVVDGLEQAPQALSALIEGNHTGKVVVRVDCQGAHR
jgi:NADPH-dependent curcumin reductase